MMLLAYLALALITGLALGYAYGRYRFSSGSQEARLQQRLRSSVGYTLYQAPDDPGHYHRMDF